MNNDLVILEEILKSQREQITSGISADDYFEYFSVEQVLKSVDPTPEQIWSGITDNGNDAGMDSVFSLYNNEIIEIDEIDLLKVKEKSELKLVIIQSKNKESYQDGPILRTSEALKKLLDLKTTGESYSAEYNEKLRDRFEIFRKLFLKTAPKFPSVHVEYHYVGKGDSATVHPNVHAKIASLRQTVRELFKNADFTSRLWGAHELNDELRKKPATTLELKISENPISTDSGVNFIVLARLSDFYSFISNQEGRIQKWMFETNVRDYQGDVSVNKSIKENLESTQTGADFWWFNNGVTIIATKASASSKTMHIENPEIVNGLQSSTVLHHFFTENPHRLGSENRNILVRVIVTADEDLRDRVIRATNSQTAIPQSSLRATDPIHRNIEDHLRSFNLFYDRRKNHYKNMGKPIDKIVSLQYLAQGLMSVILQQPNFARARPSTLLTDDVEYLKLFSSDYPITTYGYIAQILKTIDQHLRLKSGIDVSTRNNIQFYVVYECVKTLVGKPAISPQDIAGLDLSKLTDQVVEMAYKKVLEKFVEIGGTDKVAKGPDLIKWLISN
ncbi:MAG TPA: hypothetical protein DCF93_02555 [Desulfuromonas sp.]|nr:hypothetical protein [Desulfuromonas sp.]